MKNTKEKTSKQTIGTVPNIGKTVNHVGCSPTVEILEKKETEADKKRYENNTQAFVREMHSEKAVEKITEKKKREHSIGGRRKSGTFCL